MTAKKQASKEKQSSVKKQILEQLEKTPIVQIACQKGQISRATFYRWKTEDEGFASKADKALCEGRKLVNDYAESHVISAIKEGNLTAAFYWLNHNHRNYTNKLHLTGEVKTTSRKLSLEEQASIKRALELLKLPKAVSNNKLNNKKYGIRVKQNNK